MLLKTNELKGALCVAAKSDVRCYLNGVLLEVTPTSAYLVATDGSAAFIGHIDKGDDCLPEGRYIIPREAIERALKGYKLQAINLTLTPDGFRLGDTLGRFIDGRFPECRRIVPSELVQGGPAQFNPELVLACAKGLATWHKYKTPCYPLLHRGGDNSAVMFGERAFCIIMPRITDAVPTTYPFVF